MSRLRIALVSYEYPPIGGGMGKAVRAHARALARLGTEPTVITTRRGGLPSNELTDDGVQVLRVPALRSHPHHASAPEVLSFAAGAFATLPRLVRRVRPDVTVAYLTIPSGPICEAIRLTTGAPWVCFLRGQDVPGYPDVAPWMHTAAWPLTGWLWRCCAAMASPSRGLADLARASRPQLVIDHIPNGVDAALYRPLCSPRRAGPVRVLYAGRLVRFKGVQALLEAWARRDRTQEAELWIAGSGRERRRLVESAARLGLAQEVRFLGRLEEGRLARALRAADLFVNPSEAEGLPNAVLEAMASGLPVVLSEIAPHRELLAYGGGETVPVQDSEAFAGVLDRLIASQGERRRMGEAARRAACEHFAWECSATRLLGLCERAAEVHRGRGTSC